MDLFHDLFNDFGAQGASVYVVCNLIMGYVGGNV